LKSADWKYVKVGDYLIYADEDEGVKKAQVIEIDIKVEAFEPTWHYDYPYGLTTETGVVKIKYDETELVANLADLIKFNNADFRRLEQAWREWQDEKDEAEDLKDDFITERSVLRAK